jgi:hypothetical protein
MTTREDEARQVIEEHKALRKELAELAGAASKTLAAGGRGAWIDDLAGRVGRLRPRLEKHFRLELDSGFFDDIERAWPNAAAQCGSFVEEHRRYLDRLDGLLATLKSRPASDAALRAAATEVESIVEDLRIHETRETELFQTAIEGGPSAAD